MSDTYFLPLNDFHIVQLKDLHPEQIKLSAKKHTTYDREEIKHTTLLNAIAKSLGFSGGFSAYKKAYELELVPFLKRHNLKKKTDLIEQKKSSLSALGRLKRQDLSERLFFYKKELPQKVYTGFNSDFVDKLTESKYDEQCFNDKVHNFNNKQISKIDFNKYLSVLLSSHSSEQWVKHCEEELYADIANNIQIALNDDFYYEDKIVFTKKDHPFSFLFSEEQLTEQENQDNSDYFSTLLLGVLYQNNILDFHTQITFLSDNLFYPQNEPVEVELYNFDNDKKIKLEFIYQFFRQLLNRQTEGWLDILPFNENLIFLKGKNGEYDFIFKNQRDEGFNHQVYGKKIQRKDIPNFLSKYHFERWNYFKRQSFRYLDWHNAEKMYYANGGLARNYPSRETILRNYYTANGIYFDLTASPSNHLISSFKNVLIDNEHYAVSELITIKDFIHFIEENETRFQDDENITATYGEFLESNIQGEEFPVCVNWYNVMHYVSWFNQKYSVSSRLLTVTEFSQIRGDVDISIEFDKSIVPHEIMLITKDGTEGMPHLDSYRNEHKFGSLLINDKKWIEPKSKLSFMRSDYFAEWLADETCVRTGTIKDFYYSYTSSYDSLAKSKPPLDSNGMYKGVKIGFRLIYKLACGNSENNL